MYFCLVRQLISVIRRQGNVDQCLIVDAENISREKLQFQSILY